MMLALTDGFTIDGVQFFRDDKKPELFYYLPSKVQIAKADDGKPLFQFVLYQAGLPIAGKQFGGGFLLLTTELTEDPDIVGTRATQMAQQILRDEAGPSSTSVPTPVIQMVNFTSGAAHLLIAQGSLGNKLIDLISIGRPSLFGSNRLSALADMPFQGAQVFAETLRQGNNIAIIEYNLEFEVRLPAVEIIAHIETSRVRDAVAEYTEQEVKTEEFWGNDMTTKIRKRTGMSEFLRENALVELEINQGSSTIPIDSEVLNSLRDFALGAMDKFINQEWVNVGGILTPEQLQSEWLEFVNEDFTKNFDMRLTQSDVISRQFNPSAVVNVDFVGTPIEDVLVIVDTLAHPFFLRLEVNVSTSFDFARYADFVHSIVVNLHYESRGADGRLIDKSESFLFTKDDHEPKIFTTAKGKAEDNEYDVSADVHYINSGTNVKQRRLLSSRSVDPAVVINVENPGEIDVSFSVPEAGFTEGLQSIDVELAYQDRRNGVEPFSESRSLDKINPTARITRPVYVTELNDYNYRYTHVFDNRKIASPWLSASAGTRNLRIPTPFEDRLVVDIVSSVDWSEIRQVLVNMVYEDIANDFREQQTFAFFEEDATKVKSWTIHLIDKTRRRVRVSETHAFKNGQTVILPQRDFTADGMALVIGNAPGGVMKLTISPEDLAMGTEVRRVTVDMEYVDTDNGIIDRHRAVLRNSAETAIWSVALKDPTKVGYTYSVDYLMVSGERVQGPPKAGSFFVPDDWLYIEAPAV